MILSHLITCYTNLQQPWYFAINHCFWVTRIYSVYMQATFSLILKPHKKLRKKGVRKLCVYQQITWKVPKPVCGVRNMAFLFQTKCLRGFGTSCRYFSMNSMKLIIPFHFISWKKNPNDTVTSQCQSQFTPKLRANAVPR